MTIINTPYEEGMPLRMWQVKLSYEGRAEAFFAGWFPARGIFRWLD